MGSAPGGISKQPAAKISCRNAMVFSPWLPLFSNAVFSFAVNTGTEALDLAVVAQMTANGIAQLARTFAMDDGHLGQMRSDGVVEVLVELVNTAVGRFAADIQLCLGVIASKCLNRKYSASPFFLTSRACFICS